MKRPGTRVVAVSCLLVAVVGVVMMTNRHTEPTHEGRTVRFWLDAMPARGLNNAQPSLQAFQAMGTNALPYLVDHIVARTSEVHAKLQEWSYRTGWTRLGDPAKSTEHRREAAFNVLMHIGSVATNALPFAFAVVQNDRGGKLYWANALEAILRADAGVLPIVLGELHEPRHRKTMCKMLGQMRIRPDVSIPFLLNQLNDVDPSIRTTARGALVRFGVMEPQVRFAEPLSGVEVEAATQSPQAEER